MTEPSKPERLLEHVSRQETCLFAIVKKDGSTDDGRTDFSITYEFGREALDSPMVGGASYGIGDTLEEALASVYDDLRI